MLEPDESECSILLERETVPFHDFETFKIREKKFDKQFCSIYTARLASLRSTLVAKSQEKWGSAPILQIDRFSEYNWDRGFVIVIGTLYKHQRLKPSVLKELSKEIQVSHQPPISDYYSDQDKLFLEDEVLRTKLLGNHPRSKETVTGLVCALLGQATDDGSFWVEDWCFPGCCSQSSPSRELSMSGRGKLLLLISGLDFANSADCMRLELLSEWISGQAGFSEAQKEEASVLRIVVAGNSVGATADPQGHRVNESKKYPSAAALETILATTRFDSYLETMVKYCPVIVMPGEFDPSDHSIPQQPLHPCMLPKSSRYKNCRGVTNPWIGKIDNRIVAGSSGQPIEDIIKVAGLENVSPLHWLERSLVWRHFAPTAPDTLPVYPYFDADPFVMQHCPDIYFAGNMEEYDTKLYTGDEGQTVRLLTIPKFARTGTAVIVDLGSLDVWPISFGSS